MRIIVTREVNYPRPRTPITFQVFASPEPKLVPRDVAAHIIAIGAGYAVDGDLADKSGGMAATIQRKRRSA